jgi:hypothetical protein
VSVHNFAKIRTVCYAGHLTGEVRIPSPVSYALYGVYIAFVRLFLYAYEGSYREGVSTQPPIPVRQALGLHEVSHSWSDCV